MSTLYVPPSYGVSGGPGKVACRWVRSLPPFPGSQRMPDSWSVLISVSSFWTRRIRFEDMIAAIRKIRYFSDLL